LRALSLGERAFEILVGVLVSVPAVFFLAMSLGLLVGLLSGSPSDRADWRMWAGVAVEMIVGWWCAQTAWRLFARRERPDGGLLSPLILVIFGIGCMAASIALAVRDPKNLGWTKLVTVALASLGLASYRWHHGRRPAA